MKSNEDFVVCRCENVTYQELMETIDKGVNNSRELKLKTRAGMGFCTGRTCGPLITKLTDDVNDPGPIFVHLRSQPPIRTMSFDELAGGDSDD